MVDGIKSCREIKEAETSDLLVTHSPDEVVMNGQQDGLSGVGFGIGGLVCVEQ